MARAAPLDRTDLQIEVSRVPFDEMARPECAERSAAIRERFAGTPITCNAEIPGSVVRTYCELSADAMHLLSQASARRQFSARALDRIARATHTIADLAGSEDILSEHVAEARCDPGRWRSIVS